MIFKLKSLAQNIMFCGMIGFLTISCSTEATNPILQNLNFFSQSTQAEIKIISNSTLQSQAQCSQGNQLILQVSLPENEGFLCSDQSDLIEGIKQGPTCEGGVSVLSFPTNKNAANCQELTLCGIKPIKKTKVGDRFDGGVIEEWTFENLPWGCRLDLRFGKAANFDPDGVTSLVSQVLPPECPFCATQNKKTCLPCADLGSNQQITDGVVVFTDCGGSNCSDCNQGGRTTPHGQGDLFYSKQAGQCGSRCVDSSMNRVCNNGFLEGDPSFQYSQCVDTLCGCTLPGQSLTYDSGTILDLYPTQTPACGSTCSATQVRCDDGTWHLTSDGSIAPQAILTANPETTCTDPVCHCRRISRRTVRENNSDDVYRRDVVGCTETCDDYKGSVFCDAGTLTATDPTHLGYGFDSCRQADCGCRVNLAGGLSVYITNGGSKTFHSYRQNTLSKVNACSDPAEKITVVCNNNVLTPTLPPRFQYDSCTERTFDCQYTGTPAVTVAHLSTLDVFTTANPSCGSNCQKTTIKCNNGTFTHTDNSPLPSGFMSSHQSSQCTEPRCVCDVNGFALPHGQSKNFWSSDTGTCAPNSCDALKSTVTCTGGTLSGGDPDVYKFDRCSPQSCSCPLPIGGSLLNGRTDKAYRIDRATCSDVNACDDPANFVDITCTNGVLSSFDASTYKFRSCQTPTCGCSHGGISVNFGEKAWFYKMQKPPARESCNNNAAEFVCTDSGVLAPTSSSAVLSEYPESQCQSLFDSGSLGGTGGGTGNDEGPGSALRSRKGGSDGGSGKGACFDALDCRGGGVATPFKMQPRRTCQLPWGHAEIEFYGSVTAFSQKCVELPDKCSQHRQSRTCGLKGMSGDPQYSFEHCEEKAVCP